VEVAAQAASAPVVIQAPPFPRPSEPAAASARDRVLAQDADAIRAECQAAAGGDWDRWESQTAPYRAALKSLLNALKPLDATRAPWLEGKYEVLEGRGEFPLFEIAARENLLHLYDPASLAPFRRDRPVVAANRWLQQRGIDLILVVVPKMAEVYVEHFLDPCPADGVIAPHLRRTLLELLESNVEVVDGFRLFRPSRAPDPEYLYNTADTHWAPKAMGLMAREVAGRVTRYSFGATARSAPPLVKTTPGAYSIQGASTGPPRGALPQLEGFLLLNDRQRRLAVAAQTRTALHVTLVDGGEPADDPHSPVLIVGHSYVPNFREQLIAEMNLLVNTRWSAAQTTESFSEFLREPQLLADCRVVVWVTTESHMTRFAPLPALVAGASRDGR
jgi:hypothetical protein